MNFLSLFRQKRGISTLVKVARSAGAAPPLKVNNATWRRESASVNRPLLDDVVIGVNWATMVTQLTVVKVSFLNGSFNYSARLKI